jgi:steroid delta-isomerase-like uncharacterized protein
VSTTTTTSLVERRRAVVDEHIAAESDHDVARTLGTFHRPHYRVVPLGGETVGAEAVKDLLGALFGAFPDFAFDRAATYHADAAIIVEGRMRGTHRGTWAGMPASERSIDVPACCVFHFDDDRLMSESVYFDHATLLSQIDPSL